MFKKEREITREFQQSITKDPNVVSYGFSPLYDYPVIVIEILRPASVNHIPKEIKGIPVKIVYVDDYHEPTSRETIAEYQKRHRPIRPGLQIRNHGNGSIGFFFTHQGVVYLGTAAHLLLNWEKGMGMWQETRGFRRKIAELEKWINIYNYPAYVGAPGDFMVFKVLPDVGVSNSPLRLENFKPLQVVEPEIGMRVVRVGRTTGINYDEIIEVDAFARLKGVGDNPFWGCRNLFMLKNGSSLPGDSGGGIFSLDPPGVVGVSVYRYGGSTVAENLQFLGYGRYPQLTSGREKAIKISMGSKDIIEDGRKIGEFDNPPQILNGRTMIELRGLGEIFYVTFDWEPKDAPVEDIYIYR